MTNSRSIMNLSNKPKPTHSNNSSINFSHTQFSTSQSLKPKPYKPSTQLLRPKRQNSKKRENPTQRKVLSKTQMSQLKRKASPSVSSMKKLKVKKE